MKKILVASMLFFSLLLSAGAHAQKLKDLFNKKKQEAVDKANAKIDQKTSQGIDEAVNSPEKIFKKKSKKKSKTETDQNDSKPSDTGDQSNNAAEKNTNQNNTVIAEGETIVLTNIKCKAGKKKIEEEIRDTPGVSSVIIDISTGKLYLMLAGNATSGEEVATLIRKNGFEANGKKSLSGVNICK